MVLLSGVVASLVWAWKSPERLAKVVCLMLAIRIVGYAFDEPQILLSPKLPGEQQCRPLLQRPLSNTKLGLAHLAYRQTQSTSEGLAPCEHIELEPRRCPPMAARYLLLGDTILAQPCLVLEDDRSCTRLQTPSKSYSFLTPFATSLSFPVEGDHRPCSLHQ